MAADPRDDFGVFAGSEHMFFGMVDPFGAIRSELADQLARQVPDTTIDSIRTYDTPKWLTIAKRVEQDMVVAYFGVCFRARVRVTLGYGHEDLDATLTFLFGRWDEPQSQRLRTYFDLHGDADRGFTDELFRERFLAFRADDP